MTTNQIAGSEHDPANFAALVPAAPAQEASAAVDRRTGREIIPGYRLIEPIGAGGYGEVWRAEAPGGLAKAIKIVYGQSGDKRALDERKSLLRIKDVRHPFLLSLERIEIVDNQLVVVSELADSSLKDRFQECVSTGQPGIPRNELLRYLAEAADVLDYMTTVHGLQHLDIKPENLLLVGGHMKVADFGLVKSVHDASVSVIGGLTPMFAAPETFDGRPSDRSDQYSLAIVYQILLTGRCPFNGQTMAQLASQHLNGRPDLSSLPETDRAVIDRALAKDPFDRFPGCRALIERLCGNGGSIPSTLRGNESPPVHRRATRPVAEPSPRNDYKTEVVDVKISSTARSHTDYAEAEKLRHPVQGTIVDLPPIELIASNELQPTLFIGLGGCGAKTLRSLGSRLQNRLGPLDAIPSLRMLLIDTDAESLFAPVDPEHQIGLTEQQFVHTPLKPTQYYRSRSDDLTGWLSRRWIYNIPKNLKTEGIRPLGRLALVDHVRKIDDRIHEELAAICDPAASVKTSQTLGCTVDPQRPRIVIVASVSSGTGGGMVWDIAQLAHQALRQRDVKPIDLIFVLANWSCSTATEKEMATVNAYASLRELHHYGVEGCPGDAACNVPPLGRHHGLFENVYLMNFGPQTSELALDHAAGELAQFLDANTGTVSAQFLARCRGEKGANEPASATLRTFSLARIDATQLTAIEQLAQQQVIQACVSPADREEVFVREIGEILDQENQEKAGELFGLLLAPDADVATLAKRSLAKARQRMIETMLSEKTEQLKSNLIIHGGFRRFLIVASENMRRAGFVDLVQSQLPIAATVALHDQDEMVLLCEAYGVPAKAVALSLVDDRPDLLELAGRMPTRCDISWTPL